ncbi:MAG: ferritin-like domain-containing protein [Chloroflexi bacterium]|nr:ferritin-like domain-containing protein [Chloroflexota bacterium]
MTSQDTIVAWLNDAYSMENALIQVLEHRVKDAEDHPTVRAADERHLDETRHHAEAVKGCIERLGGSTSTIKSTLASLFGQMQAPMTGMAPDELVKNFLTDYAAESFEVASYRALIAAATEMGDRETAAVCERNLQEDQAMADWLLENIPTVVREYQGEVVQGAR